ncbi:hypothetical protein GCM10008938_06550 [Deinococcus roseus]|uniref:Transposase DDE domain-containing protein n=1 Tax=Deinococcus roseus TaxID=392414 RepID=A0ABQ2CXD3_9DEIO|nr:hypothetical protein GCM10008938_06550 [Deinococcus roseus]
MTGFQGGFPEDFTDGMAGTQAAGTVGEVHREQDTQWKRDEKPWISRWCLAEGKCRGEACLALMAEISNWISGWHLMSRTTKLLDLTQKQKGRSTLRPYISK